MSGQSRAACRIRTSPAAPAVWLAICATVGIACHDREKQAAINTAQGEAEAIKAGAAATAQAIQQAAAAIQAPGGMEAVNLKVAEKYVGAFGNLAKEGNTLILPGNLADMGAMVATAMSMVKAQKPAQS